MEEKHLGANEDDAMKDRSDNIWSLAGIALSFLLALHVFYFQYNTLIELDCLSPHSSVEKLDQENLLVDEQNAEQVFALSPCVEVFHVGIFFSEEPSHLPIQDLIFHQQTFILRC